MDPLSTVAGALGIVDIAFRTTSGLIRYLQDTKNASIEKTLLLEEAWTLSKLLERFKEQADHARSDEKWVEDRKDILGQFQRAYGDLAKSLRLDISTGKPVSESRFRAILSAARWSFTKSDLQSLLGRIVRLQQYVSTLLLDDQQ